MCAKAADPTGVPRSLNPSVSSIGVVVLSVFVLYEYLEIVSEISLAKFGSVLAMVGMMLCPEHDVKIRVFCGLT